MKSQAHSQRGSAHIIIVVVLVVAVLGLLGFVFWQQLSKNNSTTKTASTITIKTTTTTSQPASTLTNIASDQSYNTGLSVKYPSTWTASHSLIAATGQNSTDQTEITSPDGKLTIRLSVYDNPANEDGGGTCNPSTAAKVSSIGTANTSVSGLEYLAYSVTPIQQDYIAYTVGVVGSSGLSSTPAVGASACPLFLVSPTFAIASNSSLSASLQLNLNDLNDPSLSGFGPVKSGTTDSELAAAMKTANFQVAKQIMTSLYIK